MKVANVPAVLTRATELIQKGHLHDAEKVIMGVKEAKVKDWFGLGVFTPEGFLTIKAQAALATGDDESLLAFLRESVKDGPAAQTVADQMFPGARLALEMLLEATRAVGKKSPLPAQYGFRTEETSDGVRAEFEGRGKNFRQIAIEINDESQRLWGRNAISEDLLGKIEGLDSETSGLYQSSADGLVVVYPLVDVSNTGDTHYGDYEHLRRRQMDFASLSGVAIVVGFYRLEHDGFPDTEVVGTSSDHGDLLEGQRTRIDSERYVHSSPLGVSRVMARSGKYAAGVPRKHRDDDDGGYHPVDAETWFRCWGV